MSGDVPRAALPPRVLPRLVPLVRFGFWVLVGVAVVVWLVCRGLVWVCRVAGSVAGFVAGPVDEFVTAWLGVAPVLPRLARWRARWTRQVAQEWRDRRAGVIEGEVLDGVWR